MTDRDALDLSLSALAEAFRAGRIRAVDVARAALEAAESSGLGSFRVIRAEAAIAEARAADAAFAAGRDPGPLAGVPVSVKDLYGLPGDRTYAGTSEPLPARFERSGPVLDTVLDQLGVVVGKTHTVELAFGGIGMNTHWGTPRNPRDPAHHRVPGGSSSGAGVSLCEGSSWLAFGTDTAGSVRIPAAWTGQVALKTTKGRWSTRGIVPLSFTLDTPGLLARSIDDLVYGFAAVDGPRERHAETMARVGPRSVDGLRLAVLEDVFFDDASPGVAEAVLGTVRALERAGARLRSRALPGLEEAKALFSVGGPAAIELHQFLTEELPEWMQRLDPLVGDRVRSAAGIGAGEYIRRRKGLELAQALARGGFEDVDVLVTPTVAITPPRVSELEALDDYRRANLLALRNTGLVSFLGLCAVSLPCGVDAAGMPVGLHLIGRPGGEEALLGVARAVEARIGVDS